jgi:hypothetical protein
MNCYFAGMNGRSIFRADRTINMAQPKAVLVCGWPIKKIFSKSICPNYLKFGRKHQ